VIGIKSLFEVTSHAQSTNPQDENQEVLFLNDEYNFMGE
jgi:hypothetical protein